jgi:hypothetical protein
MFNTKFDGRLPLTAAVAVLAWTLAGCGERNEANAVAAQRAPESAATQRAVPVTAGASDPSLPDAAAALDKQPPASEAPPVRQEGSAAPVEDLTAAEESRSMPKPGQANDHSSTALQE